MSLNGSHRASAVAGALLLAALLAAPARAQAPTAPRDRLLVRAPADSAVAPSPAPADSAAARAATPSAATPADSARAGARADSAVARAAAAAPARADSASALPRPPVDYLWVVRTSLTRPADVDSVVARARELHVRGLLVQVVGRGDAWYRSDLLPRPEPLETKATPPGFDPLGELLPRAHAAGLEVHAWMNCLLVWSAPQPPRDPRHVIRAHPEWVARLRDGRRLSQLTWRQRERLHLEGVFLSPAHPGVQAWIASVAKEIVTRYPVDGVHLDYIRQPGVPIGYDMTTRARFAIESGVDPDRIDRLPWPRRAAVDSAWRAFQLAQVTAIVRGVRDSLDTVRPGIALSAAVLADTTAAERDHAQQWREWVRDGLLDRAYLMCYAPVVQTVMDQLLGFAREFGATDRVVPGIAMYNTGPGTAAAKILGARALGFPRLALYSYDSLIERPGYWPALLRALGLAPAGDHK